MNEEENIRLNQRVENLEKELSETKKELEKKSDRPNLARKYLTWLIMGMAVIVFYGAYYFYVMSLF